MRERDETQLDPSITPSNAFCLDDLPASVLDWLGCALAKLGLGYALKLIGRWVDSRRTPTPHKPQQQEQHLSSEDDEKVRCSRKPGRGRTPTLPQPQPYQRRTRKQRHERQRRRKDRR